MPRQSEDGNAGAEALCTFVDQAIYGHVRLSAGSLAVWAECEPHDGRGAEPILLEAVSCSASGRRFESVERTAFPHTHQLRLRYIFRMNGLSNPRRPGCHGRAVDIKASIPLCFDV